MSINVSIQRRDEFWWEVWGFAEGPQSLNKDDIEGMFRTMDATEIFLMKEGDRLEAQITELELMR